MEKRREWKEPSNCERRQREIANEGLTSFSLYPPRVSISLSGSIDDMEKAKRNYRGFVFLRFHLSREQPFMWTLRSVVDSIKKLTNCLLVPNTMFNIYDWNKHHIYWFILFPVAFLPPPPFAFAFLFPFFPHFAFTKNAAFCVLCLLWKIDFASYEKRQKYAPGLHEIFFRLPSQLELACDVNFPQEKKGCSIVYNKVAVLFCKILSICACSSSRCVFTRKNKLHKVLFSQISHSYILRCCACGVKYDEQNPNITSTNAKGSWTKMKETFCELLRSFVLHCDLKPSQSLS